MTDLVVLTQFNRLLKEVKYSLNKYNDNLRNELFEIEPNESYEKAYQRGETIFDKCEDDLKNLDELLEKKNQVIEFFETCQENKVNLIKQKNSIIDKLVRIKKNTCQSKEEWLNYREEWNKKRIETPDEKNRRECEEMLNEIKEEKKYVQEMTQNMTKMKREIQQLLKDGNLSQIKNELENEYVSRQEYNNLTENYNILVNQHNEMFSNYSNNHKMDEIFQQYQQRENEKRERRNAINQMRGIIDLSELKQLENWTNKKYKQIIFDSTKDNWNQYTSTFDSQLLNKENISIIIEDTQGNVFGVFIKSTITSNRLIFDNNAFVFSLRSNGRLPSPRNF